MYSPEPATLVSHDVLDRVKRSGGGVLWRRAGGGFEVAVVHRAGRPEHVWGFPKGGLVRGESSAVAAAREVTEETGYRVQRQTLLGTLVRQSRSGRSKLTVYWLMRPLGGSFRANREIDDLLWVDLDEAAALLAGRPEAALLDVVQEALAQRVAAAG